MARVFLIPPGALVSRVDLRYNGDMDMVDAHERTLQPRFPREIQGFIDLEKVDEAWWTR